MAGGALPTPGAQDTRAALPKPLRAALGSLPKDVSDAVAAHLAASQRLWEDEPEEAVAHALVARDRARRVGAVREAVGLLLYAVGRFEQALPELRAARRMSGREDLAPVVADCERGVGRPEKALEVLAGVDLALLPPEAQVEAALVASGAHRDLGRPQDAVGLLEPLVRRADRSAPWRVRVTYAHADALLDAGRQDEALRQFRATALVDADGETDAGDRVEELAGPGAEASGGTDAPTAPRSPAAPRARA